MNIQEFAKCMDDRGRKPSEHAIRSFESEIGGRLPSDYRAFLERCNGGYVGGTIWYEAGDTVEVGVHHVGGLRRDEDYSLRAAREVYQVKNRWIPRELIWVMDDPFGNATCLGVKGAHRGRVYFWDHESIPDDSWDGRIETAGNLSLVAPSFSAFIQGCMLTEPD